MQAGHDVAVQYRELLQLVMHNLNRPGSTSTAEARGGLGNVSRRIAQCVTELATAAEVLKDDDWVDPSDPTFIAENELLGAAKSIENAAKKLAALKPRREIKGKVSRSLCNTPPSNAAQHHVLHQTAHAPCFPRRKVRLHHQHRKPARRKKAIAPHDEICLIFLVAPMSNQNSDI